ncbi:MAG TPA: DUF3794 domain-containing protein, partial [Bacillota bacterium]
MDKDRVNDEATASPETPDVPKKKKTVKPKPVEVIEKASTKKKSKTKSKGTTTKKRTAKTKKTLLTNQPEVEEGLQPDPIINDLMIHVQQMPPEASVFSGEVPQKVEVGMLSNQTANPAVPYRAKAVLKTGSLSMGQVEAGSKSAEVLTSQGRQKPVLTGTKLKVSALLDSPSASDSESLNRRDGSSNSASESMDGKSMSSAAFDSMPVPVNQFIQPNQPVQPFQPMQSETVVLSGSGQVCASQNAILPLTAIKVRNIVAKVVKLTAEIIPNKVIVQGVVHEQIFFVATDGIVHHMADDVNFSTFIDIPGAEPGMNAEASAEIEDVISELALDGLSILKKIIIEVFIKVTETVQVNLEQGNGPIVLLNQVIGENSAQTLVESDFTLGIPALKIDEIVGTVRDLEVETIKDKVIIQGTLHKQIFFIDKANFGRHEAEDLHFSLFVDIPGATPGMDVQVHPRIEAIFFNLISPVCLRQKAVLEFFVKVTESVQQPVTVGSGSLFKVEEFIGENTVQELSESLITLATPAIKIREIVARVRDETIHVIQDKVIVQGIIHKQIFFISTDNIEHHQAEDVPFSLFLDIPGASPGDNVHLRPVIEAVFFELVSCNQLRQKIILAVNAVVTRFAQLNLVNGLGGPLFKIEQVIGENTRQVLIVERVRIAPTPVSPVEVAQVTVVFPSEVVVAEQQTIVQNQVLLPIQAIKVKEIQPSIANLVFNVVPDGVVVEGFVCKTVFFVATDNIVRTVHEKVPFSVLVSTPGITASQISNVFVEIENVSFNLNATCTAVNQIIVLKAIVEGSSVTPSSVTVI